MRGIIAIILVALPFELLAQEPALAPDRDLLRKSEILRALRAPAASDLLAPPPTENQLLYDVIHYDLDIGIKPDMSLSRIEGRVRMTSVALAAGLAEVDIDAADALQIMDVTDGVGNDLGWTEDSDVLTVALAQIAGLGDTFTIDISYRGTTSGSALGGLYFYWNGEIPIVFSLSQPWDARGWWPCKDQPDDKATFDLAFSVPEDLTAASNGVLVETTPETRWNAPYVRWHWRESYPMSTYLASVAATVYTRIDDWFYTPEGDTMPVTHYVYPALEAAARIDLDIAASSLEFFSQTFCMYPFLSEKYGVAVSPLGGGMEHQTLTTYGSMLITGTHAYDYIYVHELAHMWFGDLITCKNWVHIWLNEGFASYAEALWFEHLEGQAKLELYMQSMDDLYLWEGAVLRDPDNTDPWYYFDWVVYDKGAWVLHMLRRIMGDEAFFATLRSYCADARYRYSVAETADFRAICEEHHGSSLGWFFNPWLTRDDRLSYRWSYAAYEIDGALNLTIAVDQTQDSLYAMPVDFEIVALSGPFDTTLWIDDRHEEFHVSFDAGETILDVIIDPHHWVLCDKTEVTTDVPMVPVAAFLDQNVPNPFNPTTTIRFGLAAASRVSLRIYDIRGALVAVLEERPYEAGIHGATWNGTNSRGEPVASGIYFARLGTDEGVLIRKMILIR